MLNLIHGDCLKVMKTLPDDSIDAIITDPPYGTTACKWDSVIPFEFMWEQLKRIIKDNGAIIFTASQPFTSNLVVGEDVPIPTLPVVLKVFVPDKVQGFMIAEEPIC